MNESNFIRTSTVGMSREQWLEFRKPINHVRAYVKKLSKDPNVFTRQDIYEVMKKFFKTVAWAEYVFPCLGASDVASIMGLNPYKSSIEIYYEKIGFKQTFDEDNVAMFWGRELEAQIADKWQYWDGTPEGMIANFAAGNIIRKCRRVNAYVQNANFAWLYCSVDRLINKGAKKKEGVLECKTISGYAADMWESGIPPMYVVQLQTQIGIYELDFGEMAIFKDGRHYEVYPFDEHPGIIGNIQKRTKEFFEMVKSGIEQYMLWVLASTDNLKQEHAAGMDRFSPEPDGSVSYQNYLTERYQDNGFEIIGNDEDLQHARMYALHNQRMKVIEGEQRECSNRLKGKMGDAGKLSFGQDGYCTWRKTKKGSRTFRVKVKVDQVFVEETLGLKKLPVDQKALDNLVEKTPKPKVVKVHKAKKKKVVKKKSTPKKPLSTKRRGKK